tara:strand:- start:32052 stop:33464 length:1413 start_codon:yes stop_codon:yes gene_type:complete
MLFLKFPTFSDLARISTGRAPMLKGLLPPFGTALALLAMTFVISGGWWLWAGVAASSALFLPFYAKTFAAVCGLTILNFIFQKDIQHAIHAARPIEDKFTYDPENPTKPNKLVDDLVSQLNNYFKKKYGDKHVDMPRPRLATTSHEHFEMDTILGMNPWHSEILFASGFFNHHHSKMDQRMMAAAITKELAKIYMRRGSSGLIVQMGMDMLNTLQALQNANSFFKVLGILTWPLQFLFLVERSIKRSYEYEASKIVIELGRGTDLYRFLDKDPCPTLTKKPDLAALSAQRDAQKRPAYDGPLKSIFGPIHKWIVDNLEIPSDHHEHNILFVAISGIVRESLLYINELYASAPRGSRLREFVLSELQKRDGVKDAILDHLEADIQVNEPHQSMKPYEPISLKGTGFAKHAHQHGHSHGHTSHLDDVREQALSASGDNVVAFSRHVVEQGVQQGTADSGVGQPQEKSKQKKL